MNAVQEKIGNLEQKLKDLDAKLEKLDKLRNKGDLLRNLVCPLTYRSLSKLIDFEL